MPTDEVALYTPDWRQVTCLDCLDIWYPRPEPNVGALAVVAGAVTIGLGTVLVLTPVLGSVSEAFGVSTFTLATLALYVSLVNGGRRGQVPQVRRASAVSPNGVHRRVRSRRKMRRVRSTSDAE